MEFLFLVFRTLKALSLEVIAELLLLLFLLYLRAYDVN